jgi:hypothetical protein
VGTNLNLSWTGGVPPYVVERSNKLPATSWTTAITTNGQSVRLPATNTGGFFRVHGQ